MNKFYFYCIRSVITDQHNAVKLGITQFPHHRIRQYNTGDCPGTGMDKYYQDLWQINAASQADLRAFETKVKRYFKSHIRVRHTGELSEWFTLSIQELLDYIDRQVEIVRCLSVMEIEEIHRKSKKPLQKSDIEELVLEDSLNGENLWQKFLNTFLPDKSPRRIQTELWNRLEGMELPIRGYVQWPTGCGKTVGMLELIVQIKEKTAGTYRGLLIAPKNDIFNTISGAFTGLEKFGIKVLDGSNGEFGSLTYPDSHFLVFATHAALLTKSGIASLEKAKINHVHYDEVHHITGDRFYNSIKSFLENSGCLSLTGTSATPLTCSGEQRRRFRELFGDVPLHKCDIDEAVAEGWIAKPRFSVNILPANLSDEETIHRFVDCCFSLITKKGKAGKFIFYIFDNIRFVIEAVRYAKEKYLLADIYSAAGEERTDNDFREAGLDKTSVLFACQRYIEGSDIEGLEGVARLVGEQTAVNVILQICGRALRLDYESKEGWCLIVKKAEDGTTEEQVLDSIVLEILDFLGKGDKRDGLTPREIRAIVQVYVGDVSVGGGLCGVEDTIERVQAAYMRQQMAQRTVKEKYSLIQKINRDLGLTSREEYNSHWDIHGRWIVEPEKYFKTEWICWYHFLGIDLEMFPKTKAAFISTCQERGLYGNSWENYRQKRTTDLPAKPTQLYIDFTEWDKEMGYEEDVW